MAVKSSGQLAMTEIVAEFGGDAPHAMSEYYGGGDRVPQGANPNVSTTGQNKFSNFYNSVAATVLNILSNTTNYNIKTAVQAAGGDLNTPVILTIASGVTVSSTSNTTPAMKTDTGWGAGTTINITNNGSIVGSAGSSGTVNPSSGGGTGGRGGAYFGGHAATAGSAGAAGSGSAGSAQNGGNAFEHSETGNNNLTVTFDVAGTRTAGAAGQATLIGNGGGGGGSAPREWNFGGQRPAKGGAGGGGGAAGGAGGGNGDYNSNNPGGEAGSAGGATTGGAGGVPHSGYWRTTLLTGSKGGDGGDLGQAGESPCCFSPGGASQSGSTDKPGGSAGSSGTASGSAGSVLAGNTGQIN